MPIAMSTVHIEMVPAGGFCGTWKVGSGRVRLHLVWGQNQGSLPKKSQAQPGLCERPQRTGTQGAGGLSEVQFVPRDCASIQSRGLEVGVVWAGWSWCLRTALQPATSTAPYTTVLDNRGTDGRPLGFKV